MLRRSDLRRSCGWSGSDRSNLNRRGVWRADWLNVGNRRTMDYSWTHIMWLVVRSIAPILTLWVPWVIGVIAVPIMAKNEGCDADAYYRSISQHRNMVTLVGINNIARIEPTTVVTHRHIAPMVVIYTAHDDDTRTRR